MSTSNIVQFIVFTGLLYYYNSKVSEFFKRYINDSSCSPAHKNTQTCLQTLSTYDLVQLIVFTEIRYYFSIRVSCCSNSPTHIVKEPETKTKTLNMYNLVQHIAFIGLLCYFCTRVSRLPNRCYDYSFHSSAHKNVIGIKASTTTPNGHYISNNQAVCNLDQQTSTSSAPKSFDTPVFTKRLTPDTYPQPDPATLLDTLQSVRKPNDQPSDSASQSIAQSASLPSSPTTSGEIPSTPDRAFHDLAVVDDTLLLEHSKDIGSITGNVEASITGESGCNNSPPQLLSNVEPLNTGHGNFGPCTRSPMPSTNQKVDILALQTIPDAIKTKHADSHNQNTRILVQELQRHADVQHDMVAKMEAFVKDTQGAHFKQLAQLTNYLNHKHISSFEKNLRIELLDQEAWKHEELKKKWRIRGKQKLDMLWDEFEILRSKDREMVRQETIPTMSQAYQAGQRSHEYFGEENDNGDNNHGYLDKENGIENNNDGYYHGENEISNNNGHPSSSETERLEIEQDDMNELSNLAQSPLNGLHSQFDPFESWYRHSSMNIGFDKGIQQAGQIDDGSVYRLGFDYEDDYAAYCNEVKKSNGHKHRRSIAAITRQIKDVSKAQIVDRGARYAERGKRNMKKLIMKVKN